MRLKSFGINSQFFLFFLNIARMLRNESSIQCLVCCGCSSEIYNFCHLRVNSYFIYRISRKNPNQSIIRDKAKIYVVHLRKREKIGHTRKKFKTNALLFYTILAFIFKEIMCSYFVVVVFFYFEITRC